MPLDAVLVSRAEARARARAAIRSKSSPCSSAGFGLSLSTCDRGWTGDSVWSAGCGYCGRGNVWLAPGKSTHFVVLEIITDAYPHLGWQLCYLLMPCPGCLIRRGPGARAYRLRFNRRKETGAILLQALYIGDTDVGLTMQRTGAASVSISGTCAPAEAYRERRSMCAACPSLAGGAGAPMPRWRMKANTRSSKGSLTATGGRGRSAGSYLAGITCALRRGRRW